MWRRSRAYSSSGWSGPAPRFFVARKGTPYSPPARRSATASSSSGLKGLRTYASAPTRFAAALVPPTEPVRRITGMALVAGSAFSSSQSSSPLVPGMWTARTMKAGRAGRGRRGGADAAARGVGAVGFAHVDVRDLERRPQQRPERWIVIDQQDSQAAGPP